MILTSGMTFVDAVVTTQSPVFNPVKALNHHGELDLAEPSFVAIASDDAQRSLERGGLALPQPEFRNVAGHVRRRTDPVPRAVPPPANPPRTNQASRQAPPSRNGRIRRGLGDGSESDSDDDYAQKRSHGEGSASASQRKQKMPPAAPEFQDTWIPDRRAIEEEEEKRTQEMRIMREVEEKLPDIKERRRAFQLDTRYRRRVLIRYYNQGLAVKQKQLLDSLPNATGQVGEEAMEKFKTESYDPYWFADMRGFVHRLDQQRRDYLDQALYRNIEDNLDAITGDVSSYSDNCLRETLERVEMGFLRRCSAFDQDWSRPHEKPPPNLPTHLVYVIRRMAQSTRMLGASAVWQRVKPAPKGVFSALAANFLIDKYINKVIKAIHKAGDPYYGVQEVSLLEPLFDMILLSRRAEGSLSRQYEDWVCSGVDPIEIERCCLRATALEKYRQITKSVNITIKQQFCPGIVEPGVMSLVTFRAPSPHPSRRCRSKTSTLSGGFRILPLARIGVLRLIMMPQLQIHRANQSSKSA
ncbi:hypothetical protein B0H67DRAFT_328611 [Lasiosphaeris hirsuta]|uniref:Uncharacterized protein n=1 Tax=Lasiosphaeris hirsuta TaxID=260670 RepID=A0AA40DP85_9PEZI|nr:hypothetical protein B0H67DRAFT_328611 [Lasiosphaeris hirsuta]